MIPQSVIEKFQLTEKAPPIGGSFVYNTEVRYFTGHPDIYITDAEEFDGSPVKEGLIRIFYFDAKYWASVQLPIEWLLSDDAALAFALKQIEGELIKVKNKSNEY